MYYVYEWFVKETGEIIYVGKGTNNRYKVRKHNRFFNDFIKRFECESRIIKYFDTEKEAFDYEFERVFELKLKGQCVCNINKGGNGGTTNWWSEERRKEYSQKNVMKSEKQRKRMSVDNPMKNPLIAQKTNSQKKRKVCIGEKIYDGLSDVAREYGVDVTAITYWLKRGYARNLEPCYYYGEPEPEVVLRSHKTNCRAVILDGKKYESVKAAAESINTTNAVLIKALKANRPCKGHICRYDNQQASDTKSDNSSIDASTTNE